MRIRQPLAFGGIFLFILLGCTNPVHKQYTRIGSFSQFSNEAWLDLVLCDGVYESFRKADHELLAYPIDWIYDAIDEDSLLFASYLLDYTKRIGLNYLILFETNIHSDTTANIQCELYQLNPHISLIGSIQDTSSLHDLNWSLKRITEWTSTQLNLSIDSDISMQKYPFIQHYGWGRYHQLHGDWERAVESFRRSRRCDSIPTHWMIHLASSLIEYGFHQSITQNSDTYYNEAQKILQETNVEDSRIQLLNGCNYILREQWNLAEQTLEAAYRSDKTNPKIYFYLTRLHPSRYQRLGFKDEASLLKEAVYYNPAMEQAWIALGNYYYFKGYSDKAENCFKKILNIHPQSLDGLLALGKLYVSRNDVAHIIQIYENVLNIAPQSADAYYNLGIAYYHDQKVNKAIRLFERAIELNNHANAYYYLGAVYAKMGNRQKAVQCFRKRIQLRYGYDDYYAEEARKALFELLQTGDEGASTKANI